MINSAGAPGRLMDMIRAGTLQMVVDDRILAQYTDVLRRPGMQRYFCAKDTDAILDFLHHNAKHTLATICIAGLADPDDAPLLEAALAAQVPLITGNKRHFPVEKRSGCAVLSPGEFIARFCTT